MDETSANLFFMAADHNRVWLATSFRKLRGYGKVSVQRGEFFPFVLFVLEATRRRRNQPRSRPVHPKVSNEKMKNGTFFICPFCSLRAVKSARRLFPLVHFSFGATRRRTIRMQNEKCNFRNLSVTNNGTVFVSTISGPFLFFPSCEIRSQLAHGRGHFSLLSGNMVPQQPLTFC